LVRIAVPPLTGQAYCAAVVRARHFEQMSVALSEDRARAFDQWVTRRLSRWSAAEIRAFDEWLLAEAHFEFIPAVRAALQERIASEPDEEPAA